MFHLLQRSSAGSADTPILEDVQALHTEIGTQDDVDDVGPFTLHYAEGSHALITDFQPLEKTLEPDQIAKLAAFGGRSSDGTLPLFNLTKPGGGGVVIGVGWAGQWAASMRRSERGVEVQAGMEVTHLRLHPGESIHTPAVLLLFWTGPDRMRSQNLLRQLLLSHSCRPEQAQRSSGIRLPVALPHVLLPAACRNGATLVPAYAIPTLFPFDVATCTVQNDLGAADGIRVFPLRVCPSSRATGERPWFPKQELRKARQQHSRVGSSWRRRPLQRR